MIRRPVRGDVLRVRRENIIDYWHYAVYDSVDRVIHYTSRSSDISNDNVVSETDFNHFLNGNDHFEIVQFPPKYFQPREYIKGEKPIVTSGIVAPMQFGPIPYARIFNPLITSIAFLHECLKSIGYELQDPDEVIARAEKKIGEKKYNLLLNNCEHFATWCKTNVYDSEQTSLYKILKEIDTLLENRSEYDFLYPENSYYRILSY